jgi:hypothetical protein
MVYDGAVSAIKHGAVFSSVGIVLVNLIFTILMPFIGYVIIKTARTAARKILLTTVSICKDTTTTLVNFQVNTAKAATTAVSKLMKISLELSKILLRQIMHTMRRIAGFGKYYVRKSMDTALGFKDFVLNFARKGLLIIKKTTSITITTIRKLGEIILTLLIKAPEQLFKLMEVVFTKVFPGMIKIITYFPAEYFKFMTKWLPTEINFLYNMCTKAVELQMGATGIIVLFHLIGVGVKFIGQFFKLGKDFVIEFVSGINGALDIIPSFGNVLNSDTIAAIPDKLIAFILYELKFKTGFNTILNASTTSLPAIEAKEKQIAALASEIVRYKTEQESLQRQIDLSPDERKSSNISQLQIIIDGLSAELSIFEKELSKLELERIFTFDELLLRSLFCVISLGYVYLEPPPFPKLAKIVIDGIFNRELSPRISFSVGVKGSFGVAYLISLKYDIRINVTIHPFKLGLLYPQAKAVSNFADWLGERLLREDAYETVDGKKKSKIRSATRNPACMAKLAVRLIQAWIKIILSESSSSFDIFNLVTYSYSASASASFFGKIKPPGLNLGKYGISNVLRYLGVSSILDLMKKLVNEVFKSAGGGIAYLLNNIIPFISDVIFAGLSSGCSENYEFLS